MSLSGEKERDEIILSPEVRRIRNSIIKKFADEPLDIMAKFVKEVVETEEDTVRRLGAMAARVEILRMRIAQISQGENVGFVDDFSNEEIEEEHTLKDEDENIVITSPNLSEWVRLRIIENSEINGVRFPKGVVIDVSHEDGDRLLEAGKAAYVNEDEIEDVKTSVESSKKVIKESNNESNLENNSNNESNLENSNNKVTSEVEGEEVATSQGGEREDQGESDIEASSTIHGEEKLEKLEEETLDTSVAEEVPEEQVATVAEEDSEVSEVSDATTSHNMKSEEKPDKVEEETLNEDTSTIEVSEEQAATALDEEIKESEVAGIASTPTSESEKKSESDAEIIKEATPTSETKKSAKPKRTQSKSEEASDEDSGPQRKKNKTKDSSEDLVSGFKLDEGSKSKK
ncbi:MAG: hypothetical protein VYE27_04030 [Pseudomonadota bacterium]|nr:hypothetical protein [Pseudomonadota bacterium]